MQKYVFLGAIAFAIAACSGGGGGDTSPQAQPPVIVVQAPPDAGPDTKSQYESLAWETIGATPPGQDAAPEISTDPDAEPYEVVTLLREFDPHLTDAPKDEVEGTATDDLLAAFVVMDDKYLYGRMTSRAPMTGDNTHEVRFWLEQEGNMVTVEVKVGTTGRPCELGDVKAAEAQKVVANCFWTGTALDVRMPLDAIPPIINTAQPYWVSGFQTCCADEARNNPYDSIEGAQEVWRVPGLAAEVDVKGDGAAPEDAAPVPEAGG
ncbi:MAG: hypothetical protein GY898_18720 [Proteobacteria bacterium]|nr:hypothetical protein [Pseudomonadota bacterium]